MRRQPARLDRRMLLAAGLMLPGISVAARLAPPDDKLNEAAIRWPADGGRELHGFMAIPQRARGRQPAVLVLGGPDMADDTARKLVRSIAQAGFVACAPNRATYLTSTRADDLDATVRWLANGRYGTGRVGVIAMAGGTPLAVDLTGKAPVAATVTIDDPTPAPQDPAILSIHAQGSSWALQSSADGTPVLAADWAEAWARAMAFLRGHLT